MNIRKEMRKIKKESQQLRKKPLDAEYISKVQEKMITFYATNDISSNKLIKRLNSLNFELIHIMPVIFGMIAGIFSPVIFQNIVDYVNIAKDDKYIQLLLSNPNFLAKLVGAILILFVLLIALIITFVLLLLLFMSFRLLNYRERYNNIFNPFEKQIIETTLLKKHDVNLNYLPIKKVVKPHRKHRKY
jgi:hypothetical protein